MPQVHQVFVVATAAKRWRASVAIVAKRWRASTFATTVWRRWLLRSCAVQLVCACLVQTSSLSASEPSDLPSKSVLKWSSGDQLAGQVVTASPQSLSWDSSLFEEAVQLRLGSLRSITWQYDQPAKLARRRFRVATTQGNLLVGDLIGLDRESVCLENANFGVVTIPRKNVRSLVNLAGSAGRWLGPLSVEDWDADRQSKQSLLDTAQGQLVFPQENLVFKKLAVKEKTLIDVAFRWAGTLDMKFGFAVPKKWGRLDAPKTNKEEANKEDINKEALDRSPESSTVVMKMDPGVLEQLPRLEMFSDAMVLQQKDSFDIILEEVDMGSGFLRLVFEWDPQASQMKAFDAAGKLLATIALNPLTDDFEPGIFVLNQNGRLTLDNLVLMTVPGDINLQQEIIATKHGTFTGSVEGFDGQTWSIRRAADHELIQFVKDDVYLTHVACAAIEPDDKNKQGRDGKSLTRIELRDGSRVAGDLQSIADNRLQLLADVGSQAIAIRLDRSQRLDFPLMAGKENEVATHRLETTEGQCHGWLSNEEGASGGLQWKLVGSDQPVSLLGASFGIQSTDPANEQVRKSLEWKSPKNPDGYPDELYLRNGDRFPVRVLSLQSGQLNIEAFQKKIVFPVSEVVRCRMGVPVVAPIDDRQSALANLECRGTART